MSALNVQLLCSTIMVTTNIMMLISMRGQTFRLDYIFVYKYMAMFSHDTAQIYFAEI